jgi:hypothetical protein
VPEIGKELALKDPFRDELPTHPKYSTHIKSMPEAAE